MPATTVAFHVNLYETEESVLVELMGTSSFSAGANPEADYWPRDATFYSDEARFEIPFDVVGAAWPEWLETSKDMVRSYLRDGKNAARLRDSQGVGIGFCDGDMYVLWPEAKT